MSSSTSGCFIDESLLCMRQKILCNYVYICIFTHWFANIYIYTYIYILYVEVPSLFVKKICLFRNHCEAPTKALPFPMPPPPRARPATSARCVKFWLVGILRWHLQIFEPGTPPFHMGVSKNRGTSKWMVYNVYHGKPYWNGWFGGTTIFGNIHMGFPRGIQLLKFKFMKFQVCMFSEGQFFDSPAFDQFHNFSSLVYLHTHTLQFEKW